MSAIHEAMTIEEVAALVCTALERQGIHVVLCGGAVVSIYSENEYESYDLDFVATGLAGRPGGVMEDLGFTREGRHWRHPRSRFWVEFPPGPVQVGDATVREFARRSTPLGVLHLLAPTECVMDRLAGYYHWSDPQCLDQALSVARRQSVDLSRIEEWSRSEGEDARFRDFVERLESPG